MQNFTRWSVTIMMSLGLIGLYETFAHDREGLVSVSILLMVLAAAPYLIAQFIFLSSVRHVKSRKHANEADDYECPRAMLVQLSGRYKKTDDNKFVKLTRKERAETQGLVEQGDSETGVEATDEQESALAGHNDRYRRTRIQELFGEVPEYGEYDFDVLDKAVDRDVAAGVIVTMKNPKLAELNTLFIQTSNYVENEMNWYHTKLVVTDKVKYSEAEKNVLSQLMELNFKPKTRDAVGGVIFEGEYFDTQDELRTK